MEMVKYCTINERFFESSGTLIKRGRFLKVICFADNFFSLWDAIIVFNHRVTRLITNYEKAILCNSVRLTPFYSVVNKVLDIHPARNLNSLGIYPSGFFGT